ncbi:MAG: hypothetical protein AAFY15_08940, partial [Cyanobacteria bacterium J06648_11]
MLAPFCANSQQLSSGEFAVETQYPNSQRQSLLSSVAFVGLLLLFAAAALPAAIILPVEL